MGESGTEALRIAFDTGVKLEFHGAKVTSDAGLIAYRELDETLELMVMADDVFRDPCRGKNTRHELEGLLRQSVYSRLAGYEETNDAERLAVDPAMRQVVGSRAQDRRAASTSQMGRFETEILTARKNLRTLMDLPGSWIERIREQKALEKIILDLDPGSPGSARPTAGRKVRRTTAISSAPATIPSSASTIWATWSEPCCGVGMWPVPTTGSRW